MIIAAGGGRRIGGPEALLHQGGKPLVDQMIDTLTEAGCGQIVVVLGAAADQVRQTADLSRATVVVNRAWGTGVGSSIRAGLAGIDDDRVEAAVVVPVDMPGLTAAAVRRVAALPFPDVLVCATYNGLRGYPMLFGRRHWPGIATLASADVGARPYLLAHKDQIVDIACDAVADGSRVDTPELMALYGLTVPEQRVGA
ncbi:nucleotidyltransferase family protein [Verrucosispora sp. WMMD703]|uniref:4-diphosphocytidyl-2C-methyl-D-erythritol synthase n=1 Tax=Micromonospora sediminimaris TaxID=547162 RepID=A0A9W5UTQ2_9ACTN|nr:MULTISPECIES: NTP transferase domain-containing protein [Micromonospora]MBQ1049705.1 NTP transferase domain-containing protein [Micromonospora sp. C51]WBB53946.1 NTP transferase domain-containing protein [Verrucosispora sp. WMMD573]WFE47514.1 NTP transferase domain-containing protein [Verrucosispora sp. WMMD1129]SFD22016.1 molybdenum cofactor cytidylyltransferase/nicotine blue oxidoreductase [Micromonospora sediminimaris]GIJ34376.1 4-diphosphocytidyl-2C-methyl-D-erythritol synthase [Micromo